MLKEFDLLTSFFDIGRKIHRRRLDLCSGCKTALDVNLQTLNKIEQPIDHLLRRHQLRFKQFKIPNLLVFLSQRHKLVDLIRLAIREKTLELLGQLQNDELIDRVGFSSGSDFILGDVLLILID